MLYGTMGKIRGDIVYTDYLIKTKKKKFGLVIFDILTEDGGSIGTNAKNAFQECKAEVMELEHKNNHNRKELVTLGVTGECETLKKKW